MASNTVVQIAENTIVPTAAARQSRSVTMEFSPTQLAADVTSGDTIAIYALRKEARILDCGVRMLGVSGLSLSFVQLQVNENNVISTLTNPLSATTPGSLGMISAPPNNTTTFAKLLQLAVLGNNIDHTATGVIVVSVHYDYYGLSG